jgi:hypothetical protein
MRIIQRIIDVIIAIYLALMLAYSAAMGVKISEIAHLDYQWWVLFIVMRLFMWMIDCSYGEDSKDKE